MSTETQRIPEPTGKAYQAGELTVYFDGERCLHFAECVRGLPEVFDVNARPWVQPANAEAARVVEIVRRCPSGALHYRRGDEPLENGPTVTEVTPIAHGPVLVRGNLSIEDPERGIVRETRVALCACGTSAGRPYCDGACGFERPGAHDES
jgi:uncharacterized Fe-S cluster protein YjdI/CDGSH-type Zn-finger protein